VPGNEVRKEARIRTKVTITLDGTSNERDGARIEERVAGEVPATRSREAKRGDSNEGG
jgi:hypothetical protein